MPGCMANEPEDESVLVSAAKSLGKAAGKVAALAGIDAPAPPKGAPKKKAAAKGKLPKKEKAHLPRRVKKAQKKTGSAGAL